MEHLGVVVVGTATKEEFLAQARIYFDDPANTTDLPYLYRVVAE
jgi:hypothetical protein